MSFRMLNVLYFYIITFASMGPELNTTVLFNLFIYFINGALLGTVWIIIIIIIIIVILLLFHFNLRVLVVTTCFWFQQVQKLL